MATITPSVSGPLSFYKYEPTGSYVFTSDIDHTLQFSNSSIELLPFLTQTDARTVTLNGTFSTSYTYPLNLVLGTGGPLPNVISITTVTVGVGRFFPPVQGQVYQLYQYENISNTFGSNPVLSTVLPITTIVSAPSLPPAISILTTNYTGQSFTLSGTPRLQQAQSNYKIIGTNTRPAGTVTVDIAIKVNAPRVVVTPSSAAVSGMTIGTPITPLIFTSIQPDDFGPSSNFQYAWTPELPDGFSFVNVSNVPISSFQYVSPTSPIRLIGTPTVTTANTFVVGGNPYLITLRGYHMTPAFQQIIGTSVISLSFAETVLVTSSIPRLLYENKDLSPTDVVITARTYFPLGSLIATLTADALPPGLSLSTPITAGSLFLEGTPTPASSGTYTFTATNSNGVFRSLAVPITVNANVVTFSSTTPANGSSVRFIVSRPLSLEKSGYYTAPIGFLATSTSDTPPASTITYSSSINLAAYGVNLSSSNGTLTGTPTAFLVATPVTFTATDSLGTTSTRVLNITIEPDVFTFVDTRIPPYTFNLFQNRAITPYQIIVTTLSERSIQSFSSIGAMPPGLSISASGLIAGTFTGTTPGSFTISATTGYQTPPTATQLYTYTAEPDNLLLLMPNGTETIDTVFSNVQFQTIQYSTSAFVNPVYSISLYPAQFPAPVLTLPSSGLFSGSFAGIPLYSTYLLDITSVYEGVTSTTPVVVTFTNPSTTLLIVGFGSSVMSNIGGGIATTSDYVFTATPNGDRLTTDQIWQGGAGSTDVADSLYPDLAQNQGAYMAVFSQDVYDGVYNPSTLSVDWTLTDLNQAFLDPRPPIPLLAGPYLNVASDGNGQWVVLQSTLLGGFAMIIRNGTGSWTTRTANWRTTGVYTPVLGTDTNYSTSLTYINGNYVFGQKATGSTSNILVATPSNDNISWTWSARTASMGSVLRFATSNTTIVAVGYGGSAPVSYSTNSGSNWTAPSLPGFMIGANVVLNDILYARNTWVTCGLDTDGSNLIAYSSDLSNWARYTNSNVDTATRWSAIGFNGNAWTIAGYKVVAGPSNQPQILSIDANPWPTQATSLAINSQFVGITDPQFSRILSTPIFNPNPSVGTVSIRPGTLTFVEPSQSNLALYQYVPYSFPIRATGSADFIFYYATNVPVGFTFVPDPTGTNATLSGRSPVNTSAIVNLYAKTGTNAATVAQLRLNTVIPYFVNPQSGAGAYTAILRTHVDADAAQNARDNRVFPVVNPLAGPFMAPRAPDVLTLSNCFLGLCRKPCPTCRTTM